MSEAAAVQTQGSGKLLVVDDEAFLIAAYTRIFRALGYQVDTASSGGAALALLETNDYDAVVSDISMPGLSGIDLLRAARGRDNDLPVVLVTARPDLETAMTAVELGAFRYLMKPVETSELKDVVARAVRLRRLSRLKREAFDYLGAQGMLLDDRAGLEASFERALAGLWMAYQPIISWSEQKIFGHEALLRTEEKALGRPDEFIAAAERLRRLPDLGRTIRRRVASEAAGAPATIFVNLHAADLLDESLFDPEESLSRCASRVVLEMTERASLSGIKDVAARISNLKKAGFRIAVDDLGAGYAGLSSFAQLEPHVVKLDITLVRDVDRIETKQKLVRSITTLTRDLGMLLVAEGVETVSERDMLVSLGCDLLQGYLFAKPGKPFPSVAW